ncbi:MAG: nicotinate (nicotinamide) nucleotide adenylyltransferase, partial [Deltaproteobacteria bacterium]
MRIGLFGGTFNPIHQGHLRAAREVREGFPLDEIYLILAAIPPHKASEDVADAEDR